jgi:hypothetical protein
MEKLKSSLSKWEKLLSEVKKEEEGVSTGVNGIIVQKKSQELIFGWRDGVALEQNDGFDDVRNRIYEGFQENESLRENPVLPVSGTDIFDILEDKLSSSELDKIETFPQFIPGQINFPPNIELNLDIQNVVISSERMGENGELILDFSIKMLIEHIVEILKYHPILGKDSLDGPSPPPNTATATIPPNPPLGPPPPPDGAVVKGPFGPPPPPDGTVVKGPPNDPTIPPNNASSIEESSSKITVAQKIKEKWMDVYLEHDLQEIQKGKESDDYFPNPYFGDKQQVLDFIKHLRGLVSDEYLIKFERIVLEQIIGSL